MFQYARRFITQTGNYLGVFYSSPGSEITDFSWTIREPGEHDTDNVFRAEDMSLEAVRSRAHDGSVQGFGVLLDDVIVDIHSYCASPEQFWAMLEQVIAR